MGTCFLIKETLFRYLYLHFVADNVLDVDTFSNSSDFCKNHLLARRAAILSCMDGSEEEGRVDSDGGEDKSGEGVFDR